MNKLLREKILARDGFKCTICGNNGSIRKLCVHHKIPIKAGGPDAETNLVTVCVHCHIKAEDDYIQKWFRRRGMSVTLVSAEKLGQLIDMPAGAVRRMAREGRYRLTDTASIGGSTWRRFWPPGKRGNYESQD
jgi:hypothetical protein